MLKYRSAEIGLLAGTDACHDTDILRGLLLQNQHGIIYRDNPHHTHLMIHDGQCDQAILGDCPGHILLVICSTGIEHIRLHNLLDQLGLTGGQKLLHIHLADQLLLLRHITGVDRLAVQPHLPDLKNGLRNRHLLAKRNIIHIHHASRTVFRILQQLIDLPALLLIRGQKQTVHHVGRHLLQHVHRIVQIHLLHDFLKLRVCQRINQQFSLVTVHIGKCLRRLFLHQKPEHHHHLLLFKPFQYLRQVNRIHMIL